MATVQDRSNVSRVALDKWTKREQLCLASAVSCSGDQNWMTVSRSLKGLCGTQHPPDWFSQKLCAVKYGELLANVETPKRKKRTTSDNGSNVVETPTDLILRRLTEERIQELKSEIREQQETYAKLYTDVVHLQTGTYNEEQIRAMWMEIEREQEQDRQLKARKQVGSVEMSRNVRVPQMQQQKPQTPAPSSIKQEQDMDIDETCKPQGPSPLLSSLLKSSSPSPQPVTTATTSTVRVNAPTITNLLTGGSVSSPTVSSPAISPSKHPGNLLIPTLPLTKPLTGPVPVEGNVPAQSVLSPSQSAPTLSMLLEKNKSTKESPQKQLQAPTPPQLVESEVKTEPENEAVEMLPLLKEGEDAVMEEEAIDGSLTPTKEEEQQLMEVLKNFMPETIDELADILTNNSGILNTESLLEGVESLMDEAQEVEDQLVAGLTEQEPTQESKNQLPTDEESGANIKTKQTFENESMDMQASSQMDATSNEVELTDETPPAQETVEATVPPKEHEAEEKIETISSDDSSDNVPLASHTKDAKAQQSAAAALAAAKDEGTTKPSTPVPSKQSPVDPAMDESTNHGNSKETFEKAPQSASPNADKDPVAVDDENSSSKLDPTTESARKASLSDSSDVIIIPTDDESNDAKADAKKVPESNDSAEAFNKDEEAKSLDDMPQANAEKPSRESPFQQDANITSICLPDTDDDSSTFEAPTAAPKEDKPGSQKPPPQTTKKSETDSRSEEETKQTLTMRKLRDRDRSESPLVEDDASDHSATVRSRRRYSSTPVMDSIPNSPASSEDREIKVWKKSLMTVYNNLLTNKNAAIFLRPFTEEQNPQYKQVCQRPMDLQIIKRHIENGSIRNMSDLQRDVFLMCQNTIMAFKKNSSYATMARDLMHEFVQLKDQVIDAKAEKSYTPGVKVRGSARKSQRLP